MVRFGATGWSEWAGALHDQSGCHGDPTVSGSSIGTQVLRVAMFGSEIFDAFGNRATW